MNRDNDSDFDALARLWREDLGPSIDKLRKQVQRTVLLNRLMLIAEMAVGLAGSAVGIWLLTTGRSLTGAATLAFSTFGLAIAVGTRWHSSRFDTETVRSAIQSALAQANTRYRSLLGGMWVIAAALVFLAVLGWDATAGLTDSAPQLRNLVRALAATTLAIGVVLGFVAIRLRSAHRRVVELHAIQRSIDST